MYTDGRAERLPGREIGLSTLYQYTKLPSPSEKWDWTVLAVTPEWQEEGRGRHELLQRVALQAPVGSEHDGQNQTAQAHCCTRDDIDLKSKYVCLIVSLHNPGTCLPRCAPFQSIADRVCGGISRRVLSEFKRVSIRLFFTLFTAPNRNVRLRVLLGHREALCGHVLHSAACGIYELPHAPLKSSLSQKELTHTIMLHPSYFGPRMREFLQKKLYADVEGTCSGQFGYIITVIDIVNIGNGIVLPGSGQAEFITRYRAIVFKPFKGEVMDGVVSQVTKVLARLVAPAPPCLTLSSTGLHTLDGLLR